MWDGTVRNTRQGRSQKSIQAQVDRALDSTRGTDAYYKNYRRLIGIAQAYNENIQREIYKRSVKNPNALNYALSQQMRDYEREKSAMFGRRTYQGTQGNTNG